jgi:TolA-binding protein
MAPRPRCARHVCSLASAVFALGLFAATPSVQSAPPASQPTDSDVEVDAATKQLMAAQGLFQRGLFHHAAQSYADFLTDHPKHPQRTAALYALAICEYRQGEHDKAAPLLNATSRDASFAQRDEALAVLGHCQWALKHYDESVAAFDELLAKHPDSKHAEAAALNRAQVLYVAGKYEPAASACKQFLTKFPRSDQRDTALYVQGLSCRAAKDMAGAAAALTQLLHDHAASKHSTDAMLILGELAETKNDADAAIEQYRKALTSAPPERQDQARYALGVALYEAGRNPEAAAELSAVASRPGDLAEPARLKLGFAQLAAGSTDDARRAFTAISAAQDPARAAEATYGLARCEMIDKHFDQARGILSELLNATPSPPNAAQIALDRAACLLEGDRAAEAAGEYDALAHRYAGTPQAWDAAYRNAYCLHRLGRHDQSHAACEKLLASGKDLPTSLVGPIKELDAENLLLLGKHAQAAALLAQLLDQEKSDDRKLPLRLRIAQCAYFAGNYAKAAELLSPLAAERRVASEPSLQIAIFLLGDALLQQDKAAEAVPPLETFIRVAHSADTREARFKLALALQKSNNAAGAEKSLADLIAQGPDDSPWVQRGLVEYGQACKKAGHTEPATAALRRVLAAHAAEECAAPALYLLGWIDFESKRFAEAAGQWKLLEETYPKHALAAEAAFQRGAAMKEAGDHEKAAEVLRRFYVEHADSPHAAQAKLLEAQCLTAAGKNGAAEAVLASLAVQPKAGDAVLYELAWAQRSLKQPAEAQKTYRRLIQDHPAGKLAAAARVELAELLYADDKFDDAIPLLKAAIDDKTAEPKTAANAVYRLAWCQLKLTKLDDAAAAFAKLADEGKLDDELLATSARQAGLAYAQRGRWELAQKYLELFAQKHADNAQLPAVLLKLGEVQAERSDYDGSGRTFESFLTKFSADPQAYRAHFGIGWSLENRKQYDIARKAYQKVIDANNGETAARAQFQIGETFIAEGKLDKAIPAFLAVEDVYGYPKWAARALLESGRVFEQLKQTDQARKQFELLVSKYQDAPEAAAATAKLKK